MAGHKSFRKYYKQTKQTKQTRRVRKMNTRRSRKMRKMNTRRRSGIVGRVGGGLITDARRLWRESQAREHNKHPEIELVEHHAINLKTNIPRLQEYRTTLPDEFWRLEKYLLTEYYATSEENKTNKFISVYEGIDIFHRDRCGFYNAKTTKLKESESEEFKAMGNKVRDANPTDDTKLSTYYLYFENKIFRLITDLLAYKNNVEENTHILGNYREILRLVQEWRTALTLVTESKGWKYLHWTEYAAAPVGGMCPIGGRDPNRGYHVPRLKRNEQKARIVSATNDILAIEHYMNEGITRLKDLIRNSGEQPPVNEVEDPTGNSREPIGDPIEEVQ